MEPTSNICNAENSDGTSLNNAALVGKQRCCTRRKTSCAVLEVAGVVVVGTGLVEVGQPVSIIGSGPVPKAMLRRAAERLHECGLRVRKTVM